MKVYYSFVPNRWNKAVMPLEAFLNIGSSSWSHVRYIHFSVDSVEPADGTVVYVDGIHFSTWNDIIETATVDETLLPNFDSFIHRWEKTQSYQGKQHRSLYSMIPVNGSTFSYEGLESETLAQTIFGLLLAYNYSNIEYYLDSAKSYINWLLKFQYLNSSSRGFGGFRKQYLGLDTFSKIISPRNGWILGAFSLFYYFTSNETIKSSGDLLRGFMIDTLWDDDNDWFDYGFDISTHTVIPSTSWKGMDQGCYAIGLSLYYKYLHQNNTVKSVLVQQLNKGLGLPQSHEFCRGTDIYEDSMYAWWGYYWAYKAFSNSTYYNEALKAIKLTRANYEQNLDGSVWYFISLMNTTGGFDGWGFACSLPLLFCLAEREDDRNYLELFENQLLDLTPKIKTGNYSITRKRNSEDDWVNWQYMPSNAFIIAALNAYYSEIYKPTRPYLISTDKEITTSSYSSDRLAFTASNTKFAGSTSTTRVYCGDKCEPSSVYATNGTLTWTYNASTTILTLNIVHAGPVNILVDWRIPGDVDGDGKVDDFDLFDLSRAYGSKLGDPDWSPDPDLNWDSKVDASDLYDLGKNYGKMRI